MDILIYKSADVPWKVKCQRLVEHVYAVSAFGSENWSWTIQTLERIKGRETKTIPRLFRVRKHKEETWVEFHTRTFHIARKIWVKMGPPFLHEKIAEGVWRAMGWVCDEQTECGDQLLIEVYKWRSTRWWHSLQTELMELVQENTQDGSTIGCGTIVGTTGDKIATEWASEEDWMRARKRKSTLEEKYYFVSFVLDRMKLSIEHGKQKSKRIGKKIKVKTLRKMGHPDTTVHTRGDGLTVQLCGDRNVACKWINGEYSLGQRYRERELAKYKRPCTRGGKGRLPIQFRGLTTS